MITPNCFVVDMCVDSSTISENFLPFTSASNSYFKTGATTFVRIFVHFRLCSLIFSSVLPVAFLEITSPRWSIVKMAEWHEIVTASSFSAFSNSPVSFGRSRKLQWPWGASIFHAFHMPFAFFMVCQIGCPWALAESKHGISSRMHYLFHLMLLRSKQTFSVLRSL